jgi:Acetyltransferase (GNAT) domain
MTTADATADPRCPQSGRHCGGPSYQPCGHECGRLFATPGWQRAWERFTVEPAVAGRVVHDDGQVVSAVRLLSDSPLWTGYEHDARLPPVWRGPVAYLSSVYAVSNPLNQLPPETRVRLIDTAAEQALRWRAEALVVTNLEPGPGLDEVLARREPDALVRLDATCRLALPSTMDDYLAGLAKPIRTELRRRHRRATERGVVLRTLTGSAAIARLREYVPLTTESAQKHAIPALYDLSTLVALVDVPGMRLYTAERDDELLAGIIAFEHGSCLLLWSGGIRYSALREYSPYLFLLYELVAAATGRGLRWLDFGRGNLAFKGRYGFVPTDLWTAVYLPEGPDRQHLRDRLAVMHQAITDFLAVA